jgi:hypothetical protein
MLNDGNRRQHARHTLAAASNCRVTTAPSPAGRSRATGTVCVLRITRAPSVGHGGIVSGSVTQVGGRGSGAQQRETPLSWPGRIRTSALRIRNPLLCPAELRASGGLGRIRTGVTRVAAWDLAARSRDLGVLGWTRTSDLQVRNLMRYPPALRGPAWRNLGSNQGCRSDCFTGS